jgi:hypothetical protein
MFRLRKKTGARSRDDATIFAIDDPIAYAAGIVIERFPIPPGGTALSTLSNT